MTAKANKSIEVEGLAIALKTIGDNDYISLSDISKGREGDDHIRNWMRNRNTIEYLGIWEMLYNPSFKGVEFDTFRREAGLNSFSMTPRKWIEATDAIGIKSFAGRFGGTYAHKDIAFHFAMWISPTFQLYITKEYQRLKEAESNQYSLEWSVKRMLAKNNYQVHTDAVKEYVLPESGLTANMQGLVYAEEADIINLALFGCTAKEWRQANAQKALAGENIRDIASINELIVLSNLEQANAIFIKDGKPKEERLSLLKQIAQEQLENFNKIDYIKSIKRLTPTTYLDADKD